MKIDELMKPQQYVSPIYVKDVGAENRYMAGFTVYKQDKSFTNYLKYFYLEERVSILNELKALRESIIQKVTDEMGSMQREDNEG